MIPALKKIWRECFGDDEKYIDMYFDGRFKKGRCPVYTEGGVPCAMLVIYDGKIMRGGKYENAFYIYGVATLGAYRKRGISTCLLEYAQQLAAEENAVCTLAPATRELIEFYKKRGYTESFCVRYAQWNTEAGETEIAVLPINAAEYKLLRDRRFARDGYFAWDTDIIGYALAENAFCGGNACKILIGAQEYAVMYYVNGGTLNVQETTLTDDLAYGALNALALREGCTKVSVRFCADGGDSAQVTVIAMSDSAEIKNGYMNIIFE